MTPAERVNQSSGSAAHTVPFLLSHGLPAELFSSLTDSLSLPVMKRLSERLTRSAALGVRTYTPPDPHSPSAQGAGGR